MAQSRGMAALPPMSARVPAQGAPSDCKSAVGVMSAAKDICRTEEFVVSWLKLRPGYVASLSVFACFRGGGAGCDDGASSGGIGCGDCLGSDGAGCGN